MSTILNILSSVGFNWHVALANFINFLIILFLLNRFFFGSIGKAIKERQRVISKGVDNALLAEKQLEEAEADKKEILKQAATDGKSIVDEAKAKAEHAATIIWNDAEKEAKERLIALKEKEDSYESKVEAEFAKKAPGLVASLYAAALKREMTEEENNAFISRIKL